MQPHFPVLRAWDRWLSTGPATEAVYIKQKHIVQPVTRKDRHVPIPYGRPPHMLLQGTGVWWDREPVQSRCCWLPRSRLCSSGHFIPVPEIHRKWFSWTVTHLGWSPKEPEEGFAPEIPFPGSLITKLVGIWGRRLSLEQTFQLSWSKGDVV